MRRVLIFSLAYYPRFIGGAEVAVKEITDRLNPAEFEFHLVTLRFDSALSKEEKIGNVLVHRIGFATHAPSMADLKKFPLILNKYFFQIVAPLYALRLHRKYKFDILWAIMAHAAGMPAALFKIFAPRVKYVLTLQEGDPPEYIERLAWPVWPLFKRAFISADAVQVISTFLGRWAKRMGYKGEPVVVPNGVDTDVFSREVPPSDLATLKEKLGKKPDDIFLITASRLVHKNGIDDVIRALALLHDNIKFLILGTGPDEEKLKLEAGRLKLEARVQFLGQMSHAEILPYLKVSDMFIRPSRSEGMGNSFIEAFAAGIPVIATQEGGIADFLFDAKRNPGIPPTGFAVDRDSPESIAEAVKRILSEPEATRQIVENARVLVRGRYEWGTIAHRMKDEVFAPLFETGTRP